MANTVPGTRTKARLHLSQVNILTSCVPTCLIFASLVTKMLAVQDEYSSKIKITSGPLQLISVLKAKNLTPKADLECQNQKWYHVTHGLNYQMVNLLLFCCVWVALLLVLLELKERFSKEYTSMCLRKQPDIKKVLADMLGRNCFGKKWPVIFLKYFWT